MYAAEDVRVEDVADPKVQQPTDTPLHMGHEFLGVVEETGSETRNLKPGDVVVALRPPRTQAPPPEPTDGGPSPLTCYHRKPLWRGPA